MAGGHPAYGGVRVARPDGRPDHGSDLTAHRPGADWVSLDVPDGPVDSGIRGIFVGAVQT